MALARWKDLVMDAREVDAVAAFWSRVLGRRVVDRKADGARLDGGSPEEVIWIDRVPEPRTAKDRVHLDLVGEVGDVIAAGATVVERQPGWTVVTDPEGGRHCIFPPGEPTALVIDAADEVALTAWWAEVFGTHPAPGPEGGPRWLAVPEAPFDVWKFVAVPEGKTVKNRRHWDVICDDVPALVSRGARLLRAPDDEVDWHVLADPEGNEFCAFSSH